MRVFAQNFRGFKEIVIDLSKINFLVGDNSSGKSSILHLVDSVLRGALIGPPRLNDELGVGVYDYFSPYFGNSEVTFGFTQDSGNSEVSKIITVKRGRIGPRVISCSYISDSRAITLKMDARGVRSRLTGIDKLTRKERLQLHHDAKGFSKHRTDLENADISEPRMIFAFIDYKEINDPRLSPILFGDPVSTARLVSPVRALPEKFYSLKRRINARGLHFATMWLDLSEDRANAGLADVEKFGKESGLFEKIKVRPLVARLSDSPLIASVVKSGKEFFLNQVGVGVSQVVPVLVETIFSTAYEDQEMKFPVLIQQPELHLHPVAQAALGTFFFRAGQRGFRGVLETHSSFLIDRFRSEIRDSASSHNRSLTVNDIVVLFCENSDSGNTATEVRLDERGRLVGEPDEYHKFFVDELVRTML